MAKDMDQCCLLDLLKYTIWPVICIALGAVVGGAAGLLITILVSSFTMIWAPLCIYRLMYVIITTKGCFRGHLGPIMRVAVFLCIPAVPLLQWVVVTLICATIGILVCIGTTTHTFFNNEYQKSLSTVRSNIRLQPTTFLGDYVQQCRKQLVEDKVSYITIFFVKGAVTILPGFVVAVLAFIPYALIVLGITIYRLPINAFKTVQIALRTVVLRWDLRCVILVTLPLIHILFPILTFMCALVVGLFGTWFMTSENIFHGKHPCRVVKKLRSSLVAYHAAHENFVQVHIQRYDHPSGIPDGWDGTSYGIAVERILRWQRDLLLCCAIIVLELPICLFMTLTISIIKFIPSCLSSWYDYTAKYCCTTTMLGCWPFHLLAIILLPVWILLCHVVLVAVSLLRVPIEVAQAFLIHDHDWLSKAWHLPWHIICCHDKWTGSMLREYLLFSKWGRRHEEEIHRRQDVTHLSSHPTASSPTSPPTNFWDEFLSQCISTTNTLLKDGYITHDQVENMDPAVIQSIPSVTLWKIIVESVSSTNDHHCEGKGLRRDHIGDTIFNKKHQMNDPIVNHLSPTFRDLQRFVHAAREEAVAPGNVEVLIALLCSNAQVETPNIQSMLNHVTLPPSTQRLNMLIRVKITSLVLALLRVRPYQDRMKEIFTHDYNNLSIIDLDDSTASKVLNSLSDLEGGQCNEEDKLLFRPDEQSELLNATQEMPDIVQEGDTNQNEQEPTTNYGSTRSLDG